MVSQLLINQSIFIPTSSLLSHHIQSPPIQKRLLEDRHTNSQYGAKSLTKSKLYVLKSVHPKGVPAGTAKPVGPLPVREALRFGAMVRVLVKALSRPVTATARQIIVTVFRDWDVGWEVWPRR